MRLLLLATVAVVMAGCGSVSKNDGVAAAYETDQAKIAAIEQSATRVGVRVIWVNPPRRSTPSDGSN